MKKFVVWVLMLLFRKDIFTYFSGKCIILFVSSGHVEELVCSSSSFSDDVWIVTGSSKPQSFVMMRRKS